MISTALLEGENTDAEDPVATLATFHVAGLASEQFFPVAVSRSLLAFATHQVCPGVLSFRLVFDRTDKFMGTKAIPKHNEHRQFYNQIPEQEKN